MAGSNISCNKQIHIIIILLPAVLYLGCSPFWGLFRKGLNLDDLEQKVNKIDSATTKQNQLIYELNADLITEIENIKQELQELSAKFDDAQSEMRRLYQKLGARSYGYRSFQDSSLTKFNSEDRVDSEELYNNAYLDYTRGDFDQALNGFKSYLQYFPNTQFSDNAQYWIGECFYSKKMYREAIDEFQKVIENYPEGNKVVAALYKIGLCYELLGEYKKAKYYYQKVFSEYPGTQEAKLAEERYKKLN